MYYCFGCGAGGNVFTYVMEYENYTFVEAVKYLAERAGISQVMVSDYENGKRKLTLKAATKFANALGEDPQKFFP